MERYEAYKDSGVEWIGEIPEGWEVVPIKALFSFGKGLPITKADLLEEGEPVISYGQIHSKANTPAHIKQELLRYVSPSFVETNAASITHKGDFLFADTSEDVEGSGSFVFHDLDERVFAGYHTLILRPTDASCGRYLSYLFQDDQWRVQLRSRVSGVKLFSLTLRIFTKASFLLPSVAEQQAIADYLDAKTAEIDALVADCEREVELLQEYRKAVISEAVTKGLDPDAPMKDSGIEWIGEIPEGWRVVRLDKVATRKSGHTPDKKVSEYWNGDIVWISLADSQRLRANVYVNESTTMTTEAGIANSSAEILPAGSVLLSRDASVGLTAIAGVQLAVSQHFMAYICGENLNNEYLRFVFVAMHQEFEKLSMGSTIPTIGLPLMRKLTIPHPTRDVQDEIVDYLNSKVAEIDSLITDNQSVADKLREYRRSLISEAVTGKFKVPGV